MSEIASPAARPLLLSVDGRGFGKAMRAAAPPLLFGLRLWVSASLALYAAFWLQLDAPYWAAASASIVCQPQLGASLRKGWFRMIGTLVGAAKRGGGGGRLPPAPPPSSFRALALW